MRIFHIGYLALATVLFTPQLQSQTHWTRCSEGLPPNKTVLSLAQIGATLFAGTDKAGVYKSENNGASWQSMPQHNAFQQTQTWSMATIDTFLFAGQRGNGVLRISRNGAAWVLLNNGLSNKFVQDIIAVNGILYVATYGGGVFYSDNLGNSWSALYNNQGMEDHKGYSLAGTNTILYAGTAGVNIVPDTGVAYRAVIGENEWTRINTGFIRNGVHLESVFSLDAVDTLVFAGTDDVGLFRSTDHGDNWVPVGGYNGDIHAVKIAGSTVYYGTTYGGVFRSLDSGQNWSADNAGLAFGNMTLPYLVKDFLVAGTVIYAATDIGVFKQTVPNLTVANFDVAIASSGLRSFPNPFSKGLMVQFYNPEPGLVTVRLFDLNGKVVLVLLQKEMPEGDFSISFEGADLPGGLYYLRLDARAEGRFEVIKVLKQN